MKSEIAIDTLEKAYMSKKKVDNPKIFIFISYAWGIKEYQEKV